MTKSSDSLPQANQTTQRHPRLIFEEASIDISISIVAELKIDRFHRNDCTRILLPDLDSRPSDLPLVGSGYRFSLRERLAENIQFPSIRELEIAYSGFILSFFCVARPVLTSPILLPPPPPPPPR